MTEVASPAGAVAADEQRARTLRRVVWTTLATAVTFLSLQIIEDPATLRRRIVTISLISSFGLLALGLNQRGFTRLASTLFLGGLTLVMTGRAWTLGGLDSAVTAAFTVFVVMGGVLLGWRGGAVVAASCAAITLMLIIAKVEGVLPPRQLPLTPLGLWLSNCAWIVLAFSIQGQLAASLREALGRTERELAQRKLAERDLRDRVKELHLLHAAATLLQRSDATVLESFQELVALIPAGWQHPDVCVARISFGDYVAATPNWRSPVQHMTRTFATEEGSGTIEVGYLEPQPAAHDGPFLAEERAVLDSLAEMLTAYVTLRRQRQGLERLVAERTRELSVARDVADRASRAKSAFLANMSHEIRTPLNAVLGHAQLLEQDPSLPAARRRNASAIQASGSHLLAMINDVLEASKMEAGRTDLAPQRADLHAILADVEHMFTALARAKSLELRFERDGSVPRAIHADAAKIRQVLINLLGNAVKFTERGAVTVRASAELLSEQAARVTIDVTDTGPGVVEEDQPRIFAAFEQSSSGKHAGGTGLGLTISRSFARLMQGNVTLKSCGGAGSTFSFTFIAEVLSLSALPAADLERPVLPLHTFSVRPRSAPPPALAPLLTRLPAATLLDLRAAAIQARTTRLEQLAAELTPTAPEAADAIAALVREFRYDDLVTAIDGLGFQPSP